MFIATFVFAFLFVGTFFLFLENGNTQTSRIENTNQQKEFSGIDHYLLLGKDADGETAIYDQSRRAKSVKFDHWSWVRESVGSEATEVNMINDWQLGVAPLPITKSDAIVVGTILSGKAFFSNDRSGIYSEFSVNVSEWIKQFDSDSKNGVDITAQRAGGRIRYSAGNIVTYRISGQEMPQLNSRYVLFLSYDKQGDVFSILTAYQLLDNKVHALDGRGRSKKSGFEFTMYDGVEEEWFLNQIAAAIQTNKETWAEVSDQ
jgi:hypothetical protein